MANGSAIDKMISPVIETSSASRPLSSSLSSLSATGRPLPSDISKIYRHASNLFWTRQLTDALSTLESIISPDQADSHQTGNSEPIEPAPIATASRSSRIKVWSLYLTLIDAIVKLGPEEGKTAFGSREWRGMVSRIRDGHIWTEIVRDGYHGIDGSVDADVVINLVTLLLTHAPSQEINQRFLEDYISARQDRNPDFSGPLASDAARNSDRDPRKRHSARSGTDTPRDLESQLKILELYTLHVLPRNEEWAYAKEFITFSEILDEERRDAFLQTLQSIKDAQVYSAQAAEEARQQAEEHLEEGQRQAMARNADREATEKVAQSVQTTALHSIRRRSGSETDYGIESHAHRQISAPPPAKLAKATRTETRSATATRLSPPTASTRPLRKVSSADTPYTRATSVVGRLREFILSISRSMQANPLQMLRTLFFIVAIILAMSRRDIRERLRRLLATWSSKVRGTIGMGVKVSYI